MTNATYAAGTNRPQAWTHENVEVTGPQYQPHQYLPPLTQYNEPHYADLQPQIAPTAPRPGERRIDQGRFWVGAVLTSTVAALAGVIGLVITQDLLRVPVSLSALGMSGDHIGTYGLLIGLFSMLAAVLFAGMMAFAPRPTVYYGALTGLLTALAVLLPFTVSAALTAQLALAGVNLIVGVLIMTLIPVAAVSARTRS